MKIKFFIILSLIFGLSMIVTRNPETSVQDKSMNQVKGSKKALYYVFNNWIDNGKVIDVKNLFDLQIIKLKDGKLRLYAELHENADICPIVSFISEDGITFREEKGDRLVGPYMPYVVQMPSGDFRMYFSDRANKKMESAYSKDGIEFYFENETLLVCGSNKYEAKGASCPKILTLPDMTYRMYYKGIDENNHMTILSAVSVDGLSWKKENGVRLDPAALCPGINYIGNVSPFISPDGKYHLYFSALLIDDQDLISGIFDAYSSNGLDFKINFDPIVDGATWGELEYSPGDPNVIITDRGLKMYFGLYAHRGWVLPESGVYAVSNNVDFAPKKKDKNR